MVKGLEVMRENDEPKITGYIIRYFEENQVLEE